MSADNISVIRHHSYYIMPKAKCQEKSGLFFKTSCFFGIVHIIWCALLVKFTRYLPATNMLCCFYGRRSIVSYQQFFEELVSSTISLSLKNSDTHHMADIATSVQIILLTIAAEPPKINATRSNWNIPTSPQFMPPIISRRSAILSSIFSLSFFKICGDLFCRLLLFLPVCSLLYAVMYLIYNNCVRDQSNFHKNMTEFKKITGQFDVCMLYF